MSTLKVDAIRHNSATSDAITTASDGTCTAKLTSVGGGQLSNRNIIINPEFKIWQRGTSWSSGVNRYVMDRWYQWGYNAIPSQITGTNGSQYGVRLRHNSSTSNSFSAWASTLEKKDIFHTIGKHLVLSFWMRKGSAFTGGMSCQIVARTDSESKINSGTNVTIGNQDIAGSLTTDWQKFTIKTTQVVPTTEVVGVNFWHHTTSGTDANNYFDLNQVQLEVGDTATSFEHRNTSEELSRCQRYFYRIGGQSRTYQVVGNGFVGQNGGTKCAKIIVNFPTTMRDRPTLSVIGTDAFKGDTGGAASAMDCTATANTGGMWNDASSTDIAWVDFGRTGGGSPANGTAVVVYTTGAQGEVAFSAEL